MTPTPESTSSLASSSPTVATIIYSNSAKFPLGQIVATPGALELLQETGFSAAALLIRPCEVLSRVANVTILEVANNALRVLLQHRHVIIGSLA